MSDLDQKGKALLQTLTRETKPTMREIAAELGLSPGAVQDRLTSLIKAGMVTNPGGKARAWALTPLARLRLGGQLEQAGDRQRELGAFIAGVRLGLKSASQIDQINEVLGSLPAGTQALIEAEALKDWHHQGRPTRHGDKAQERGL